LRQEFAVLPILADEDDDVVALLGKHESQDVGNARDEILKGLAVRSLIPHLNTPPTWSRRAMPASCNAGSHRQSGQWLHRFNEKRVNRVPLRQKSTARLTKSTRL
jgi:hypothetical protein